MDAFQPLSLLLCFIAALVTALLISKRLRRYSPAATASVQSRPLWVGWHPTEITPMLFLSSRPRPADAPAARGLGICAVMDITNDEGRGIAFRDALSSLCAADGHTLSYLHIHINDRNTVDLLALFPEAHRFIDRSLAEGKPVLVHCEAGVSRSATFVMSYLMYSRKIDLCTAFADVKKRRPIVQPNFGFIEQLQSYEEATLGTPRDPTFMAEYILSIYPNTGVRKEVLVEAMGRTNNVMDALNLALNGG